MPAKAVSDDASAIFHTNGFQEVFKVLTVLLGNKGSQTKQQELATVPIQLSQADTELMDGGPIAVFM